MWGGGWGGGGGILIRLLLRAGGCTFGGGYVPYIIPGESYRRRLRSLLLCMYDVHRALINSLG